MLKDFAEVWRFVCNLTSQCWRRISLTSDVVCQSYGNVYRGSVFSWTRCILQFVLRCKKMQNHTSRSSIQLSVMIFKLCPVKLLHSVKTAAACSIGDWQIRLASASVIPDGVGHAKVGCNGPDGRVMLGGWTVSLAVMMIFLTILQPSSRTVAANAAINIVIC